MTRVSRSDWSSPATSIRQHSAGCPAGGIEAFEHFRDLVSELLCSTVGPKTAGVWMPKPKSARDIRCDPMGRHGPGGSLVHLTSGACSKLVVSLFLEPRGNDNYVRASLSTFQYQLDEGGEDWWSALATSTGYGEMARLGAS